MQSIDLFAGTGGFTYALEQKGIKCVFANDIVPESKVMFENNFDVEFRLGDLQQIDVEEIPEHDILTAGFPCQPFSIAGERRGFEDERSNVFWKIIEILEYHQPQWLLLENVKNLTTHDHGRTFKIIKEALEDSGYTLSYKVLDTAKITGIPQHRERIYIVGYRADTLEEKRRFKRFFNLDFEKKPCRPFDHFLEDRVAEKYYYTDKYVVWEKVRGAIVKRNTIYQYRRTIVRENKSGMVPTLTANMGGGGHNVPLLLDDHGIRKLTPRECFSLQGFGEDYILPELLSDTKLYKLAGNAITTTVAKMVTDRILDFNKE